MSEKTRHELMKERHIRLSKEFSSEQLQGARMNVPGFSEAAQKLDDAGLAAKTVWQPKLPPPA